MVGLTFTECETDLIPRRGKGTPNGTTAAREREIATAGETLYVACTSRFRGDDCRQDVGRLCRLPPTVTRSSLLSSTQGHIFWRHANGSNYVWHVNGALVNGGGPSIASQGPLPAVADMGWQVQNSK